MGEGAESMDAQIGDSTVRRRRWVRHALTGGPPAKQGAPFRDPTLLARVERSRALMERGAPPNVLLVGVLSARQLRAVDGRDSNLPPPAVLSDGSQRGARSRYRWTSSRAATRTCG